MDVAPLVDEGLGNSSYVIDLGDGGALVIDPQRDPRPYLAELARRRLRPRFVAETHLHADFVSGARELQALGAQVLAPVASYLDFDNQPLSDGDVLDLGGLSLQVIATPGHTPEHLSYLMVDVNRPVALFSGGTLIAGGVARTDLVSTEQTEPLARAAYRSIPQRLFTLPDDLPVYPTHGAGSFCSSASGGGRTTTIGAERRSNHLLAGEPDEDTFVARLLGGLGSYPPYFLELREVNRAGPDVHGPRPSPLGRLSVDEVAEALADGAELVDTRPIQAFASGHIPGALSNPWRKQFASWLGWLVPRERPIVFVADDAVDRTDLGWAALTIGFEHIVGELAGGMATWEAAGRAVVRLPLVDADTSGGRLVVDVRQQAEFAAGHAPRAMNVELGRFGADPVELPDRPVLVHCGHGERAMSAASLLVRTGRSDIVVLRGGPRDLGELEVEA